MRTAAVATRWACVLGAFVSVAACSRNGASRPAPATVSGVGEQEITNHAGPDLSESPVFGVGAGLEATWVTSSADGESFARAITPYLDAPVPADVSDLAMWEANGLRVVRVAVSDWPALSATLGISGASQRQWLGVNGRWTEIVSARDEPRGQVVALDAERVELGPGRLRLLGRCWLSPVAPDGSGSGEPASAEFTIELVPQLLERRPTAITLAQTPRTRDPIDEGLVFSRTRMRLRTRGDADGRVAYIVVSERPGVDWRELAAAPPESSTPPETEPTRPSPGVGEVVRNGSGEAPTPPAAPQATAAPASGSTAAGPGPSGARGAGPAAPLLPTLGEAMFASPLPPTRPTGPDSAPKGRKDLRAVLVLIPRAPSQYRLFPAGPSGAPRNEPIKP